jgi:hypothetical protein
MSQRDSRILPDLQVLALDKLVLHEDADPRRVERLKQRLIEDNRLKNPPVVAPILGTDRYVVLDGANRVSALIQLGSPHVVAQVVRYEDPGVELDTWYHVVAGISREEFSQALEQIAGMRLVASTLDEARESLAIGDAAAYIGFADAVYQVRNGGPGRLSDIHLLNRLVAAYKGHANIYRASNDVYEKQAPIHPDITALVVFPKYRPADIMMLARNGDKVPGGITRHIIPGRALRINLPLSFIMENRPITEKQAWLQQWIRDRANANRIRFYSESTFLFDE